MSRIIFGNETAENDDLLYDCPVRREEYDDGKQIITGRWGTGKTAFLLLSHEKLSTTLRSIDSNLERLWYLDERALDNMALVQMFNNRENDYAFRNDLDNLWRAEITRRALLLLAHLAGVYGFEDSPAQHWQFVQRFLKFSGVGQPVWKQLPQALKILKVVDASREQALGEMQQGIEVVFTREALQNVQDCLRDISEHDTQPVIAIEPIDTPTSALEQDVSLAQSVVTSLINVFQATFQPNPRQRLQVFMAIPWHRYSSEQVIFPQKIKQYRTFLQWNPQDLRIFMNKRIEWEFERVRRSFNTRSQDAWNLLFDGPVRNEHCRPAILEDSFSYILRHTHHRPREVQRLARNALEYCARSVGRSIDDVLKGSSGLRVD